MSNHNRGVLNEPDPSTYGAIFVFIFILHTAIPSPVVAQTSEAFTSAGYGNIDTSMIVIVVILICSFFIIGFFSIYIRQCSDQALTSAADGRDLKSARGLDPSVIESFPVFQYSGVKDLKIGKNALECAVCINEFDDDDELRLLPKCDHVFHPECIDAWLLSHSTCPVCRSNLSPDSLACDKTQIDEPIESVHESNNSPSPNQNQDQISINIEDRIRQARYYDIWSRKIYRTGKFTRSHSTGHSLCQLSENSERHRLVLPEEVRKRILTLKRTTSCVFVYPKEEGSRRGYRSSGEGSSRGKSYPDRLFWRSDRWVFTMTPPFVSRTGLSRSPKAGAGGSIRTSLDCLAGRADGAEKSSVRPPV